MLRSGKIKTVARPATCELGAYGHAAAVLHDWLYRTGTLPRRQADRVFFNALRSSGIARWRAWLMWGGVRIGGASHYGAG